jgi:ribosome-binding factor A
MSSRASSGGTKPARAVRFAGQIQQVLSEALLRGVVRDARARDVMISEVHVSPDLRHARVYLRLLHGAPTDDQKTAAVMAMRGAAGALRREVGGAVRSKYTPELQFHWDEAVDRGQSVAAVLEELSKDGHDDDTDL